MLFCPNCGTQVPDRTDFCPNCGTSVKGINTLKVETVKQQEEPTAYQNSPAPQKETGNFENSFFFSLIKPLLKTIDNGTFFREPMRWLYVIFSLFCIFYPLYLLYTSIEAHVFKETGFAGFSMWIFIALAGWVGFQIWWNRKNSIISLVKKGDDFSASPSFSHFIQTFGEWIGFSFTIISFGFSVILLTIPQNERYYYRFGGEFNDLIFTGLGAFIFPFVGGFFIVVVFRFVAESIRVFTSIANNTKKQ